MTDHDDVAFAAIFVRLRAIFPLRGERAEIQQLVQVYFRVLRRFALGAVDAGANVWIERGARFPKPAEWLDAIPKAPGAGLARMAEDDAREYFSAVANGFEAEPCACHDCTRAGVTHRMLRYVPDTDADDRDVRMQVGDKVVVRGHWAHGDELTRWYSARDTYMGLKAKFDAKHKLIKRMPKVTAAQVEAEAR